MTPQQPHVLVVDDDDRLRKLIRKYLSENGFLVGTLAQWEERLTKLIDDPALRLKLLRLCVSIVEADGHVAEGESIVLLAAVEHWGLHREMLKAEPQHG